MDRKNQKTYIDNERELHKAFDVEDRCGIKEILLWHHICNHHGPGEQDIGISLQELNIIELQYEEKEKVELC